MNELKQFRDTLLYHTIEYSDCVSTTYMDKNANYMFRVYKYYDTDTVCIDSLSVVKPLRNNGIATKILLLCKILAKEYGCNSISVICYNGWILEWAKRLGFTEYENCTIDDHIWLKSNLNY